MTLAKPYYLPLSDKETPKIKKDKLTIAVVAGSFEGTEGPAETYSPLNLLRMQAKTGCKASLNLDSSFNSLLYLLDGELLINPNSALEKKA